MGIVLVSMQRKHFDYSSAILCNLIYECDPNIVVWKVLSDDLIESDRDTTFKINHLVLKRR